MHRTPTAILAAAVVGAAAFVMPAGAGTALETPGRVDAVTVYRGQALVTRVIEIPGPAGLKEVIITDLPERIVPGSIHAESGPGLTIRSVSYRVRPVMQDVRAEVREIDVQLRALADELDATKRSMDLLTHQKEYLDKFEQFTAMTANVELTKGVLDPVALKDLTMFTFEQRRSIATEEIELGLTHRDLSERINLLQRERQEIAGTSSRTAREAVVFVNQDDKNGSELLLRYVVDGATWAPSYNVRTDDGRSGVTVEYNASIQQISGEDWENVTMTLSTATPSLDAKAPQLDPLTIVLRPIATLETKLAYASTLEFEKARSDLYRQQREVGQIRSGNRGFADANATFGLSDGDTDGRYRAEQFKFLDRKLNSIATDIQVLELATQLDLEPPESEDADDQTTLSVTYRLAGRTNLASRSDRQLIQISSVQMPSDFYRVAVPVLTDAVYEEALVSNTGGAVLLAGPVETYVNGQFVGAGEMPTVAAGEAFTVGFGVDSSLRSSRELTSREESIQGGNRLVTMTYTITVDNFAGDPATLRVLDRMPRANEEEVKLTMVSTTSELSDDAAYQKSRDKTGLLRWDIAAPPRNGTGDSFRIEYQIRMEYDKQMTIGGIPAQG